MSSHKESGRVYLALFLVAAAAAAFFLLRRDNSTFSAVELRMAEAHATAIRLQMPVEQVMALLDLGEGKLNAYEWVVKAEALKDAQVLYRELGLAVAAVHGQDKLVAELVGKGDPAAALVALRARPEGLVATRYLSMVERYRLSLGAQR